MTWHKSIVVKAADTCGLPKERPRCVSRLRKGLTRHQFWVVKERLSPHLHDAVVNSSFVSPLLPFQFLFLVNLVFFSFLCIVCSRFLFMIFCYQGDVTSYPAPSTQALPSSYCGGNSVASINRAFSEAIASSFAMVFVRLPRIDAARRQKRLHTAMASLSIR